MNKFEPIFKTIFGPQWNELPVVMRLHYSLKPYSNDVVIFKGHMDINYSAIFAFFSPLFKLFKILVPYRGQNIPVIIYLRCKSNSPAFFYDRTFYIEGKKPYHFYTYMEHIKNNEVVDYLGFGMGLKIAYEYDGQTVNLQHKGYVLKLFGYLLSLPLTFLLGKVSLEKRAISSECFSLHMQIKHPLFGLVYEYAGEFRVFNSAAK